MTPGTSLFALSYALFVSIAMMQNISTSKPVVLLGINFFMALGIIIYSWKKVEDNFKRVYFIERYIHTYLPKDIFAGFEISRSKDPKGQLSKFQAESVLEMGKIRTFAKNIIIGGIYYILVLTLMGDDIGLIFSLSIPTVSFVMLALFNYWGLYLFGLFYFLCYFCFFHTLTYPWGYITCIVFFFLFFFNLNFLNNWYWAKLAKEEVNHPLKDIKSFFLPFFLFTLLFILIDSSIEKDKSFWTRLSTFDVDKSLFKRTDLKKTKRIIKKLNVVDPRELYNLGSRNYARYQSELNALDKQIENLNLKIHPTPKDLARLVQLSKQKTELLDQIQNSVANDLKNGDPNSAQYTKLKNLGKKLGVSVQRPVKRPDWKDTSKALTQKMDNSEIAKYFSKQTKGKIKAVDQVTSFKANGWGNIKSGGQTPGNGTTGNSASGDQGKSGNDQERKIPVQELPEEFKQALKKNFDQNHPISQELDRFEKKMENPNYTLEQREQALQDLNDSVFKELEKSEKSNPEDTKSAELKEGLEELYKQGEMKKFSEAIGKNFPKNEELQNDLSALDKMMNRKEEFSTDEGLEKQINKRIEKMKKEMTKDAKDSAKKDTLQELRRLTKEEPDQKSELYKTLKEYKDLIKEELEASDEIQEDYENLVDSTRSPETSVEEFESLVAPIEENVNSMKEQSKSESSSSSGSSTINQSDQFSNIETELDDSYQETLRDIKKKEQEEQSKFDWKKIAKYAIYILSFFAILYMLRKFFAKDRVIEVREELSHKQKEELTELIDQLPNRFKNFEEEVQMKYRIFHQMVEVLHYHGETFAPPAMIIPISEIDIPHDGIRAVGNNLGVFFNAINFAGRTKFSSKDQKVFRKSFDKFKIFVSKQL